MRIGRRLGSALLLAALLSAGPAALAQKQYGPGVSDGEIRIGQTMPYSGPASAYGTIGRAELAYFAGINRSGGVNGRKITLLSPDDSLSPPKTVEQTRKLVEQENVQLMFSTLGTPTSMGGGEFSATAPTSPSPLEGEGGVGGKQPARRSWPSA
ncbi:MAG TPA: ABC transporter substrate-binding protein [Stellaceae bacterium]|nr:ABC transporter substrate-binding protein [Stellaceae bacterium]